MVDGAAYLASLPRLAMKTPFWNRRPGTNTLDGGCPFYGTCATKDDGGMMAVGALEPQFFDILLSGLGLRPEEVLLEGMTGTTEQLG